MTTNYEAIFNTFFGTQPSPVQQEQQLKAVDPPSITIPPGADGQVMTVSIDGYVVTQLTQMSYAVITPDGHVVEHVHRGMVRLGDGTLTDNLMYTEQCDLCLAEATQAVHAGTTTPAMAFFSTRHRRENIAYSALSGQSLCRKHQSVLIGDDGVSMIMSHAEVEYLEAKRGKKQW